MLADTKPRNFKPKIITFGRYGSGDHAGRGPRTPCRGQEDGRVRQVPGPGKGWGEVGFGMPGRSVPGPS